MRAKLLAVQQKISSEQKRRMLDQLSAALNDSLKNKYARVLKNFAVHARIEKMKKKLFSRLLNTTAGKVIKLYMRWKTLPERKDDAAVKRANAFEHTLFKFASTRIRRTSLGIFFNDFYYEGEALKKRAV